MAGEGADATLNGLVLISDEQHCDNHTLLDHADAELPEPRAVQACALRTNRPAFSKARSSSASTAQKTDSKQTSKSLLLTDDADMNSQPALEIYADDVKCTHGSTTGPVDEDRSSISARAAWASKRRGI